ncbi:hypothetical protein H5410_002994 [Solanum commersonii]|uniref:Uncharacterized protein n=1 Tax=Solanum commersonii TaxID=4109 RepID=A0A9J6B3E7_SOLCO|nr:hypothetical protein H5410_002994 [Solanum commersonii]
MGESMHCVLLFEWDSNTFVELELAFEASIASLRIFGNSVPQLESLEGTRQLKERRNEGLMIAEPSWRVLVDTEITFCSVSLSHEGKDQVSNEMGGRRVTSSSAAVYIADDSKSRRSLKAKARRR